jgi:hypothetical protein
MQLRIKMLNPPSGASTLTVNTSSGNVTKSIVTSGATAIAANAWQAGDTVMVTYDGTNWQATGVVVAGAPVYLQASRTYYVGGTGASDSNDGLSATVTGGHGPWATPQHAMNVISQFNLNGFNITINVANGTYGALTLSAMSGSGNVNWVGNNATPSSCVISGSAVSAITAGYCGRAHTFSGFGVAASGTYAGDPMIGVHVFGSGTVVQIQSMSFGACLGGHFSAEQGATLLIQGGYNVTGGCAGSTGGNGAHANAATNGQIQTPAAVSCTITTSVTFAAGWSVAGSLGFLQLLYSSITGGASVTGQRYNVSSNAVISTNGGGATYYPGTVAGSTASGGQYV